MSLIKIKAESPEEIVARLESALDTYIDEQAQSYRYESIRTMVTYVADPNPKFNAEGLGALEFRSACYTLAIEIIDEVNEGRPIPTEQELLAEMPNLEDFINYT
jgi:predicted RNase H-like HicB family nuclease